MNDIDVLRRVRAGNTKAYEELVVKYEKRIFQVALGLLRDEQDALDATQEVFVKAFLRAANFRNESDTIHTCSESPSTSARTRSAAVRAAAQSPCTVRTTRP